MAAAGTISVQMADFMICVAASSWKMTTAGEICGHFGDLEAAASPECVKMAAAGKIVFDFAAQQPDFRPLCRFC